METTPPLRLYCTADLRIDLDRLEARRGGERLDLPGLTFDALVCLVERSPGVVSHVALVERVWDGAAISDETITQRISLLRRALGDDSERPRYVATVRGRGYRWIPRTEALAALPDRPPPSFGRRRVVAWLAALLAVAVFAAAGGWHRFADRDPALPSATPSGRELTARAWTYLARHRESDNELAVELFRRARAAQADPLATAGLSLALSQRATKFNRSADWAVVAEALARRAVQQRPDAEAYHALGLALDAQGRVGPALAAYRRAVRLDPDHAGAVSSAAYLLGVRGELAEALRWDLRARELDADQPYLEIQIGEVLATLGADPAAERWLHRALTLRPDNVFAPGAYAGYKLRQGDADGAEAVARQARARGIRRPELWMIEADAAWMRGAAARAAVLYRRAEAVNPHQAGAEGYLAVLATSTAGAPGPSGNRSRCRPLLLDDGDEWPQVAVSMALVCDSAGDRDAALRALDVAIDRGYRDAEWLRFHPAFAALRRSGLLASRIDRIEALVAVERDRLRAAPWLPADLRAGLPG